MHIVSTMLCISFLNMTWFNVLHSTSKVSSQMKKWWFLLKTKISAGTGLNSGRLPFTPKEKKGNHRGVYLKESSDGEQDEYVDGSQTLRSKWMQCMVLCAMHMCFESYAQCICV